MKYLFSKAGYVVFSGPHCGEGLFFYIQNYNHILLIKYRLPCFICCILPSFIKALHKRLPYDVLSGNSDFMKLACAIGS